MLPYNLTEAQYLYGALLLPYKSDPYEDVLARKIKLAKGLLQRLVQTDGMEDTVRINEVSNAIKSNRELLKELGYTDKDIQTKLEQLK